MSNRFTSVLSFFIIMSLCRIGPAAANNDISSFSISSANILQYETVFFRAVLSPSTKNSSDPSKKDLFVTVTHNTGISYKLCFFYTGKDTLWEARFTPSLAGDYIYMSEMSSSKITEQKKGSFKVAKSSGTGFLRKGINNPYYPVFDSGEKFFGIGHNLAWVNNSSVSLFENYFKLMSENGCNLARIWINSKWSLPIETVKLGQYDYGSFSTLDTVLDLARKYGLQIILVLDTYGSLMKQEGEWSEGSWDQNPYNIKNGGMCAKPEEFFTNKSAKEYYKKRLKYIMSRYGAYTTIISFELWNEMDTPTDWLREMLTYAKTYNPHGQLMTLSPGYPWGNNFAESEIFSMRDIGIAQRHLYGNQTNDLISNIISVNRALIKTIKKPIIVGEFGMDTSKDDRLFDQTGMGTALHSSLWASVVSGSCSTALNWWWDSYIKPKNLYPHYKALSAFTNDIDWASTRILFIDQPVVKLRLPDNTQPVYSDVSVGTRELWGDMTYKEFTILNNGDVQGGIINSYLQGDTNKHLKLSPVFNVNYPAEGQFTLDVGIVSQHACLNIYIDDKLVLKKDFPAGSEPNGPWKRSLYRKDLKVYQCVYDDSVTVPVPKGRHKIQIMNSGKDWIGIKKIRLKNYSGNMFANARAAGMSVGDQTFFWIQNNDYTWQNSRKGLEPSTIKSAYFELANVPNGSYKIEWWDTIKGEVVTVDRGSTDNNTLTIGAPPFKNDIACKIKPEK